MSSTAAVVAPLAAAATRKRREIEQQNIRMYRELEQNTTATTDYSSMSYDEYDYAGYRSLPPPSMMWFMFGLIVMIIVLAGIMGWAMDS